MDERKLVKSGMFSHTIALPKEWVTRHKLNKGSKVYLTEHQGALLLTPEKSKISLKEKGETMINIDGLAKNSIKRDIIASYLTNSGVVKLIGKDIKKNAQTYKEVISQLPGLEVIEETGDYIIVHDFINIEELNIPDIIKRTDIIIRSLFEDTFECLQNKSSDLAESIRKRDKEINRLVFLVYKCLNHVNDHPQEGKNHGIESPSCSTHIWELNGYLEKIGDEIKRFASLVPKSKISAKENKEVENLLKDVEKFYIEIMTSLYKGSTANADESSEKRGEIKDKCNAFLEESKSPALTSIVSKLIYLISFINSISRIVRYILFDKHVVVRGPIIS